MRLAKTDIYINRIRSVERTEACSISKGKNGESGNQKKSSLKLIPKKCNHKNQAVSPISSKLSGGKRHSARKCLSKEHNTIAPTVRASNSPKCLGGIFQPDSFQPDSFMTPDSHYCPLNPSRRIISDNPSRSDQFSMHLYIISIQITSTLSPFLLNFSYPLIVFQFSTYDKKSLFSLVKLDNLFYHCHFRFHYQFRLQDGSNSFINSEISNLSKFSL